MQQQRDSHRFVAAWLIAPWIYVCWMPLAAAVDLRPILNYGLMQQPSSQYYHLVQGATLDIGLYQSLSIRATYIERPQFKSQGYVDQDMFLYGQIGAAFYQKERLEMYGSAGFGRCWGYIKQEDPSLDLGSPTTRNDYAMNAFVLTMEGVFKSRYLDLIAGHTLLIGKGDEDIIKQKVAWPFSVYYVGLSVNLSDSRGHRL